MYEFETLEERICDFHSPKFRPYYGDVEDDQVLFEVDFEEIQVSVEELYRWICEYRVPGRKYSIGDCEDPKLVLYSLLLTKKNRDPESVASGFKTGLLEEAFHMVGSLLTSTVDLGHSVTHVTTGHTDSYIAKLAEPIKERETTVKFDLEQIQEFDHILPSERSDDSWSSQGSIISEKEVHWTIAAQNMEVPEEDLESSDEESPEINIPQSHQLRGWFEGKAVEVFPDSEPTPLEHHYDGEEIFIPEEIPEEDYPGLNMIDPEQWRPTRGTVYRQLDYIWGIRPQRYITGKKLRRASTRKMFDPG